ncbi:MAG: tyrosine-type recombinase/integrase [Limisphaerales bacterium]
MKTLRDWLASHLAYARALRQSRYTVRTRAYHGGNFLDWLETHYGVTTPDRLRREHLESWTKHLAAQTTWHGLPPKPRTLNKHIESTRAFLSYLAEHHLVMASLLAGLVYVKEPQLLPIVLRHEQTREVLRRIPTTNATGWRDRAMLELLYSTGIRAGELLGLDVAAVDFTGETARVFGKGQKERIVPIGKTALRLLESYLRGVRPFLLRDPREPALFINEHGQRLSYAALLRRVHRHAGRVALDVTVTPHTFRRSCATEMIRAGANLYHVKDLLGHETLDTLRHYVKLNVEDIRETLRRCHPRERAEEKAES